MTAAAQLALPLDYAPDPVRNHGLRAAHPRPLVSLGKRPGRAFASFRTTPAKAWRFPELEYANAGSSYAALVLDCDNPAALKRGLSDLPQPNWIVWRAANDHAHISWALAKPVHRHSAAKVEPLRYFAAVAEYYTAAVGADPGYAGVLSHNPAPKYRDSKFSTTWGRRDPYTLDELATVIPFNWEPPKVRQTGVGRNVDLFEALLKWAARHENINVTALSAAMIINQQFTVALPQSEVVATAKSVEKYRAQWAARGWHKPQWLAKQSARGKASGAARRDGSIEAAKPWEAEGISRAWWYRKRQRSKSRLESTQIRPLNHPLEIKPIRRNQ